MSFYKFLLISFVACLLLLVANSSLAQQAIVVTPAVIDQKAEARDILEFSVKITNNTLSKVNLYSIINDISVKEGRQEFIEPSLLDKSTSLARWIEISRGVIELWPAQTKDIPFSVHVNLNAKPGKYYAVIIFAQGSTRAEAEAKASKLNQPQTLLNIEVEENIIEKAQLQQFKSEKNFFLNFPVKFLLGIENTGNREIKPVGSIHIYNRRGEEVGSVDVNQAQAAIVPQAYNLFENLWQSKKGFGQYKAVLAAEYGNEEKRDLQDTIYFWVLPWQFLIFFGGGLLVLIILLLLLIRKRLGNYSAQRPPYK